MKKIDIWIVDDHSLFRDGLKFLLSQLEYTGMIYEAGNGAELIERLPSEPADIILMDIEMPVMNGITATEEALKIDSRIKIIALSMYSDESYYTSMIEAGVSGFLLKHSGFDEVKQAITDVFQGKNYFSPQILQSIVCKVSAKHHSSHDDFGLTGRETEILYYICKGFSNLQIAEKLSISKRTVDKHRENLLQKTGSGNTASLVIFAIKNHYFNI